MKFFAAIAVCALVGLALRPFTPQDRMGEASSIPPSTGAALFANDGTQPYFRVVDAACCLDMVSSLNWTPNGVTLRFLSGRTANLNMPGAPASVSLDRPFAPFAIGRGAVWAIDPERKNVVALSAAGAATVPGSESLGPVQGIIATEFQFRREYGKGEIQSGDELFLTSQSKRGGADSSTLSCYRPDLNTTRTVLDGVELYAPTGLALSPDRKHLYVADERPGELVWMVLNQQDACAGKWSFEGVLARFPLKDQTDLHRFRGLLVDARGDVIGAAPGGVFFFAPDGTALGKIELPGEVTYLLPSPGGFYAAIADRLAFLPMAALPAASPEPPLCQPDPPQCRCGS